MELMRGLEIQVEQDPLGGYYVVVPALPGCGSQGDTESEAIENVGDAIMVVLDVLREDDPDRLQLLCGAMAQTEAAPQEGSDSTAPLVGLIAAASAEDDLIDVR
jgi:predicted RNase H-like HicB family nuclease